MKFMRKLAQTQFTFTLKAKLMTLCELLKGL